ncbi:MAG: aminopeptidase P N-terminal domain-containing protein [Clostridia bacterium]|nr:aminopeptidase P N-terminal domain-containing protein [Clostridia bacterium]
MSLQEHRNRLYATLPEGSIVVSYAGVPVHTNEDDYYNFEANSQFFYLTGLERENMVFLAAKIKGKPEINETLFIEEADPKQERWTGKMPTKEEAAQASGIKEIKYTSELSAAISRYLAREDIDYAYFDLYRCGAEDPEDYNALKAREFARLYPGVTLRDLHKACVPLRERKDAEEIDLVRKAIDITRQGLDHVMKTLKPGMKEYQAQANFEYTCKSLGAVRFAFNTISAAGKNGCMMHYNTNREEIQPGSLLLMDLGAKYGNYCSDISRTFPADGVYTPRQKEVYQLVLKANLAVAEAARPGITLKDLNEVAKSVLGEGLVKMGLIQDAKDVGKYYMHSVSHSIGIDCHDATFTGDVLQPGWIISDEPGLYIDEEAIGIRIEDDLLITEDGCEVLSKDIIKDPDEIEKFMRRED